MIFANWTRDKRVTRHTGGDAALSPRKTGACEDGSREGEVDDEEVVSAQNQPITLTTQVLIDIDEL